MVPLSLSPLKLARISWLSCKTATKRELQSLIGLLSHASTVVHLRCTFFRLLIDTTKVGSQPSHFIHLNSQVHADLQWWAHFLRDWSAWSLLFPLSPTVAVSTDSSGSWGCGGALTSIQWTVVSGAVASFLGLGSHCSKGAGASCNSSGSVRQAVATAISIGLFR